MPPSVLAKKEATGFLRSICSGVTDVEMDGKVGWNPCKPHWMGQKKVASGCLRCVTDASQSWQGGRMSWILVVVSPSDHKRSIDSR